MSDDVMDELGPIDYIVVEFPAGKADFSGEMAAQLKRLIERGIVRVLDLLIITKDADGAVDAFELHEFDADQVGQLRELGAELGQLLSEDDVGHIAAALELGTVARRSSGRTPGRRRSPARSATPAASWSPAAASPCRRSSPPPRRRRTPQTRKEPEMPLGPGRRGPGVIGATDTQAG